MINSAGWREQLSRAGVRLTTSREIVANILHDTQRHLSAEDIFIRAVQINPSIGLTTVYRALELFTDTGIVQRFDFGDGKARYELASDPQNSEHHHHLICIKCKKIINYDDFVEEELELMKKTENALSKKHHFKIMHHIIHFYGICDHCR
jgi:Fur family transcriptional regulator, ferric uptake regulator